VARSFRAALENKAANRLREPWKTPEISRNYGAIATPPKRPPTQPQKHPAVAIEDECTEVMRKPS